MEIWSLGVWKKRVVILTDDLIRSYGGTSSGVRGVIVKSQQPTPQWTAAQGRSLELPGRISKGHKREAKGESSNGNWCRYLYIANA